MDYELFQVNLGSLLEDFGSPPSTLDYFSSYLDD